MLEPPLRLLEPWLRLLEPWLRPLEPSLRPLEPWLRPLEPSLRLRDAVAPWLAVFWALDRELLALLEDRGLFALRDRELLALLAREPLEPLLAARELFPERELLAARGLLPDPELFADRELFAERELFADRELPADFEAPVVLLEPLALCARAGVDFGLRCDAVAGLDDERLDVFPRLVEPRSLTADMSTPPIRFPALGAFRNFTGAGLIQGLPVAMGPRTA